MGFARRFTHQPFRVEVLSCPPEHIGLGVGTQLGLAVAKAVAAELGLPYLSAVELAERVGRGARSGVGVHGFDGGGLILDAGKRNGEAVSSLHSRRHLPEDWRVVLACPRGAPRWHGDAERRAFAAPSAVDTTRLRELFEILGKTTEYATFAEALHEYNRLAGAVFAEAQGGDYSSPEVAALIARVRALGVPGVGQSSWGPTVFAITPDADRAAWLAEQLASPEMEFVTVTRPDSAGGTRLH
jgi:beta-RFAP synthase